MQGDAVQNRHTIRPPGAGARLVIRSRGRVVLVKVDDIRWIEAAGDYMRVHTAQGTHLLRITMGELEQRLDPSRFVRIHRSAIVGMEHVKELRPLPGGDYRIILACGLEIRLSRSHRKALRSLVGEAV